MVVQISISDKFDGGNIEFKELKNNDDDTLEVVLHIKPDVYTELEQMAHMQYFSFRVTLSGIDSPQKIKYTLANANEASYPEAWSGTTVFYSSDVENPDSWRRNQDTFYTQGELWWEHLHTTNGFTYFSYFPPYSYSRHLSFINKCSAASNACSVFTLGQTLQGRELECVTVGSGELTCWIIHRQHPGEVMAEYYAEGLLSRLLGLNEQVDPNTTKLVSLYTFYIVPCMCLDGAVLGHLRTNSVGANLNREWCGKGEYDAPTIHNSPEVYYVLTKMDETGVDLFLDVHGDEELPYNFISGAEHVPKWDTRMQSLHGAFVAAYARANSDMQQEIGYTPPSSKKEVLGYMNVATNQVANRFNCLGVTLEMPFKDCRSNSDPEYGWTPERSRQLGASVVEPLIYIHPYLRAEGEFWKALPAKDKYVETTDDCMNEMPNASDEFKLIHKRLYSDVHEVRKKKSSLPSMR